MGLLGYTKLCSGLRLLDGFVPSHLGQGTFASQSPMTCLKPSYTAGMLGDNSESMLLTLGVLIL